MKSEKEIAVLNNIYQGAKTGANSIRELMTSAESPDFISDLKCQEGQYEAIAKEAETCLAQFGTKPEPISGIKKLGMKAGIKFNTALSSDTNHLALLMINGSTMGITDMTRVMNSYSDPDPKIKGLANKLINMEQQNIEKLKTYLS